MRNLAVIIKASQALIVGVVVLGLQNGVSKAQAASLSTPSRDVPSPVSPAITVKSDEALPSRVADLPDAPRAQANQTQLGSQASTKQNDHTQINPVDLLSPRLISGVPMSMQDKFEIYIHKTYSPAALIFPLFSTGIKMANPNDKYPSAWQDGMGAFGRNYGDAIARRTAKDTAEFTTQVFLHEDPRYERSSSKNPATRAGHAIAWTFFDRSDSGSRMFAFSNFTGAAAGSFVGMAYLPDGYSDATHAEQRMLVQLSGDAVANILTEFEPTWGPIARKLHVPQILPAWWTPDHRQRP